MSLSSYKVYLSITEHFLSVYLFTFLPLRNFQTTVDIPREFRIIIHQSKVIQTVPRECLNAHLHLLQLPRRNDHGYLCPPRGLGPEWGRGRGHVWVRLLVAEAQVLPDIEVSITHLHCGCMLRCVCGFILARAI